MSKLIKIAIELSGGEDRLDDTITDRLNHLTTTTILVVMAVLVSTKQYVGSPIECWAPKEFTGNHADYTNSICWVKGTYYVPYDRVNMPSLRGRGRNPTVTYYQWVPLILLLQAFLFCLPRIIWRSFQDKSGLDVYNFVEYGRKVSSPKIKTDIRESLLDNMVSQIERYLKYGFVGVQEQKKSCAISLKHIFTQSCFRCFGHRRLNYFTTLQLVVKFLYLVNSVGQIFLLDLLLNMKYHSYGPDVLSSLVRIAWGRRSPAWRGDTDSNGLLGWEQETRFPKVTMCDFKVRRLGAVHNYSVQCALVVNLFNEKVFLLLWFWIVFMSMANFLSLLRWLLKNFLKGDRYRYVKNLLVLSGVIKPFRKEPPTSKRASSGNEFIENNLYSVNHYGNGLPHNYSGNDVKRSLSTTSTSSHVVRHAIHEPPKSVPVVKEVHPPPDNEKKLLVYFVAVHLRADGVFLLHLLNQATNTIVVMETVERLWINFRERVEMTSRAVPNPRRR